MPAEGLDKPQTVLSAPEFASTEAGGLYADRMYWDEPIIGIRLTTGEGECVCVFVAGEGEGVCV